MKKSYITSSPCTIMGLSYWTMVVAGIEAIVSEIFAYDLIVYRKKDISRTPAGDTLRQIDPHGGYPNHVTRQDN